jgi:hypothetical protein
MVLLNLFDAKKDDKIDIQRSRTKTLGLVVKNSSGLN